MNKEEIQIYSLQGFFHFLSVVRQGTYKQLTAVIIDEATLYAYQVKFLENWTKTIEISFYKISYLTHLLCKSIDWFLYEGNIGI